MAERLIAMETRLTAVIAASIDPQISVSAVCVDLGISRDTYYRLRRRFAADGIECLLPRSRRPKTSPAATPQPMVEQIVAARRQLLEEGWDGGPLDRSSAERPRLGPAERPHDPPGAGARRPGRAGAGQAAAFVVQTVRGVPTQRAVAARRHRLAAGRWHLGEHLEGPRRPRPQDHGQPGRAQRDRRCRLGMHAHRDRATRRPSRGAHRGRVSVHPAPPPRRS